MVTGASVEDSTARAAAGGSLVTKLTQENSTFQLSFNSTSFLKIIIVGHG